MTKEESPGNSSPTVSASSNGSIRPKLCRQPVDAVSVTLKQLQRETYARLDTALLRLAGSRDIPDTWHAIRLVTRHVLIQLKTDFKLGVTAADIDNIISKYARKRPWQHYIMIDNR